MKASGLACLIVGSMLAPIAPATAATPGSALLITRIDNEQWQLRLVAGGADAQFSGVVESDRPISGVRSANPAAAAKARLSSATSLGTTLAASAGGVDGVSFSASAGSKLCLRDAGSSGVRIYRGSSMKNAVPVTVPVALTSADACGDAVLPMAHASVSAPGRKYHPGHYTIIVNGVGAQSFMTDAMQKSGMRGIVRRYTWRSVEPSKGVYDFSVIKSDLAWAKAHGAQFIVVIQYKTTDGSKAGPADMDAPLMGETLELRNKNGGYTLKLWSPTVIARYNAMVKALGAQVDGLANFEGLGNQESSLSLDSATLKAHAYTPEKYRDALINMLSASAASLPTSRVFWYMNFLSGNQSYIGSIASAVAPLGVVMGGPDAWPDNKSLQSAAYPYYTQFDNRMPLFIQVEGVNYAEPHKPGVGTTTYWTMLELYQFALTDLHVNYMFWMRIAPKPANSPSYDWDDALPVIKAHPTLNP